MFDVIIKGFGKKEKKSGQIAKERLQALLGRTRAEISPDVSEATGNGAGEVFENQRMFGLV